VLAGSHQHRRTRFVGVVQHAHRVAEAGRRVQADDGEPISRLRVAARHRHRGRFHQRQDVTRLRLHRERVHQRQLGRAGIAEDHFHALLPQDFEEGALAGHDGHGSFPLLLLVGRHEGRSRKLAAAMRVRQSLPAPMRYC
jgi:hypothetical protein